MLGVNRAHSKLCTTSLGASTLLPMLIMLYIICKIRTTTMRAYIFLDPSIINDSSSVFTIP